ncbi:MAG: UPF0182 family protein [Sedimentisphaerales bacterium]|nr:UPF0182 family protein [Sedimentisphaerales bacterium]
MYTLLIVILIAVALVFVARGLTKQKWRHVIAGVVVAVFTGLFFWFLSFWGEALWFQSIGYEQRFWKIIFTKLSLAVVGALFGIFVVSALTWHIPKTKRVLTISADIVGAYIGGRWALAHWDRILLYLNRVATGVEDPIFGRDTGFYLFTLPVYNTLHSLLLVLVIIALLTSIIAIFVKRSRDGVELKELDQADVNQIQRYNSVYLSVAALLFVLAWGKYLDRFGLMYSALGAVSGPGWTDENIRLPMYVVIIILAVVAGLALAVPPLRNKLGNISPKADIGALYRSAVPAGIVVIILLGMWIVLLGLVPAAFQWLKVQPNEITLEEPYIEHNIAFTRQGFGLDELEERRFPVSGKFTQSMIEQNRNLFDNIRLWDWRALDSVYKQFQEIRLYYEFTDVDIDRYTIQDRYRQVMVSAREMQLANLPRQSQTFVNKRFKYTHGNGITLTTVSDFTPEGLPNLLVKDIPPKSMYPELNVDQPRIYYGELTDSHVIVNSKEEELDYPSGEKNIYTNYSGTGGVQLKNIWRRFLFGWKFDGTRLFFSSYPTSESRILFHRNVKQRVKTVAPFLKFDDDPYVVLADGKLYWIIDGYTVSSDYPYSEPIFSETTAQSLRRRLTLQTAQTRHDLDGINYIRNSVKTVVDAFNGTVTFYIFEPDDPLIKAWQGVFPNLFKNRGEMPREILNHIRYPSDMLLIQGAVYSKYHMTDPAVFYNQEDLWVRATEKYYGGSQFVQPYYIMWEPPESDEAQFVLMQPFTPKNKQVLIAWIAAMCDPENYGRLLAYKFPKEKRILGTQQVETKIDQDPVLSGRLSLWDQRGSRVIRGNVLAIPIEETLIYVEPIYLQAETAAYPELRLVAVMHNDNLSYAETFDDALYGLFGDGTTIRQTIRGDLVEKSLDQLIKQANNAFENYLNALGDKDFDQASGQLKTLSDSLRRLSAVSEPNKPEVE